MERAYRFRFAAGALCVVAAFVLWNVSASAQEQSSAFSWTSSTWSADNWVPELPESVISEFRNGDVAKYSPPYESLSDCEAARDKNALDMPWLARTDCFTYRKTYRYYTHSVKSTKQVEAELKFFGIRAGLRPNPQDIRDRVKESRGWNDACVTRKGKKKLDSQLSALFSKIDAEPDLENRLEKISEILDKKTMERFWTERTATNPVSACSSEYAIARLEAKKGVVARELARRWTSSGAVSEEAGSTGETLPADASAQEVEKATDDIFADLFKSL